MIEEKDIDYIDYNILKKIRTENKFFEKRMAEEIGISPTVYRSYERNEKKIPKYVKNVVYYKFIYIKNIMIKIDELLNSIKTYKRL